MTPSHNRTVRALVSVALAIMVPFAQLADHSPTQVIPAVPAAITVNPPATSVDARPVAGVVIRRRC
ncbi:hypothetical protein GCM10011512_26200 [Tersicoccus solisilvae]|uniref:Uncharacterized protein n=1 Tax=Tersicoccus solisilvae TaxID=1882339 RepID=A0ABQ1PIZ9_9MICC|nr:hypothetical protein GCM10011512_26200 [Tersicoccus solisilvae]